MKRGSSRGCGGSGVVVVVVDGGTGDSCRKGCCARGGCCSYGIGGDVLGMFIINSHYIIITSCLWRIGLRYTIALPLHGPCRRTEQLTVNWSVKIKCYQNTIIWALNLLVRSHQQIELDAINPPSWLKFNKFMNYGNCLSESSYVFPCQCRNNLCMSIQRNGHTNVYMSVCNHVIRKTKLHLCSNKKETKAELWLFNNPSPNHPHSFHMFE